MSGLKAVFKKELLSYFLTPIAYVFISVFLFATGAFTFYMGRFYEREIADLEPFFAWLPWVFLFLLPAISMRLWAEERRSGTIELLLTLPVSVWQIVVGKFLAAWAFSAVCLLLTTTIWITVNYLGDPDNGVILATYLGSLLMAGGYLAIGSCISATTRNQVVAFVLSVLICLLFTISGFPVVIGFLQSWMPNTVIDVISSFSFLSNFQDMSMGILEFKSLVYFVSLIVVWLFINTVLINHKRI